jgi:hypothetical protein
VKNSTPPDKLVAEALISKHNQALAEHQRLFDVLLDLYDESRENFAGLRDLHAAGRVFGLELEIPDENARLAAQRFFLSPQARAEREIKLTAMQPAPAPTPEAVAMPRIRDIVLERLKAAEKNGTRAAPIREYIRTTYGKDIHEKTVGMTLYRLANEKLAHRIGITWFYGPAVPESQNPGAGAPGSQEDLLK